MKDSTGYFLMSILFAGLQVVSGKFILWAFSVLCFIGGIFIARYECSDKEEKTRK